MVLNIQLWKTSDFFCNLFFECFVCRDLTINLNFITWTPLSGLTRVCTAPSSGRHVQEHKGATRSPSDLFWVFIFFAVHRSKQDLRAKPLFSVSLKTVHSVKGEIPISQHPTLYNDQRIRRWKSTFRGYRREESTALPTCFCCFFKTIFWVQEVREGMVHAALERLRLYIVAVGHKHEQITWNLFVGKREPWFSAKLGWMKASQSFELLAGAQAQTSHMTFIHCCEESFHTTLLCRVGW